MDIKEGGKCKRRTGFYFMDFRNGRIETRALCHIQDFRNIHAYIDSYCVHTTQLHFFLFVSHVTIG